jgi:hypothetical protein
MEMDGEKSLHYIKRKSEPLLLRRLQQLHPIKIGINAQLKQDRGRLLKQSTS